MEKLSSTSKRLVLCGLVVSIAIAVVLLMRGDEAPQITAAADGPARTTAESASGAGAPAAAPELAPEPTAWTVDAPPTPEQIVETILKKDKRLAAFMEYHKNVLLDVQRRDEYRKLLADADMMKGIAEGLMQPGSGPVDAEEHYRRLMQIDYFKAALTWKGNPARDQVLALTSEIIGKDNFNADQNTDRRQMLAGGKMELYRLMYEHDTTRAEGLVASAKGTRMEALTRWMSEEELRRRATEVKIQKDMEALREKEAQETEDKTN
jgi:hypothetical protein